MPKYISKFIDLVKYNGRKVSIDVTTIVEVHQSKNYDGVAIVYTTGSDSPIEIGDNQAKVLELVEERRKQLWENEHKSQLVMINLLESIRVNTQPVEKFDSAQMLVDSVEDK